MAEPTWVQRFRATNLSFPHSARDAPHRCLYLSNASGTTELYAWDRHRDSHLQLTRRTEGTRSGRISPDGEWVWWFDDTDGDELGRWMRQPFDAGVGEGPAPAQPAVPHLGPGYPVGLALGRRLAAVGMSTRDGVTVHLCGVDGTSGDVATVYSAENHGSVQALSYDETLLAIEHSEHGDSLHPAVRVFDIGARTSGGPAQPVADLWDGPGLGLRVEGFGPGHGDTRLLVHHERADRSQPLVWDVDTGEQNEPRLDLPGALHASWYPDGQALLVRHHWHGRDELYRHDLASGQLTRLSTPRGVCGGCEVRGDGTLEYLWSSGEQPPVLLAASGAELLSPAEPAPPSVSLTDAWVPGPGGDVHALVARPTGDGPAPAVFLLHGGPGGQVADGFWPARAALVDAGYAVVHVNYRGSSGYGTAWLDADRVQPGLIELEDVGAVHDWAVESGVADPDRCVIAGISWGGYLTLLGLGTQPERWAAGLGIVPIGDMVALYEDEMEPVREADRSLFGGSPEEIPEKWARSSPITYAEGVKAPLLVLASSNDPRCPIRQVDNYLARLTELGRPYEEYRFEAGHFSMVVEEQIHQMRLQLDFLARHVPASPMR
jgi:dienelactone hydrolase